MSLYNFWVNVHAQPTEPFARKSVELAGRQFTAVMVPPGQSAPPLQTTFDVACDALGQLERLFIEPDGSFVWRGTTDSENWQVDGVLYDRGPQLAYVELHGTCPANAFDALLQACGWPDTTLLFQLVREAVFFDESEFRRYVAATPF